MSNDIVEFLSTRFLDDEAAAWSSVPEGGGSWPDAIFKDQHVETYVKHQNPVRTLREIRAKRHIVQLHRQTGGDDDPCALCVGYRDPLGLFCETWPCQTIRCIAQVYDGHPDYRQEWAPWAFSDMKL